MYYQKIGTRGSSRIYDIHDLPEDTSQLNSYFSLSPVDRFCFGKEGTHDKDLEMMEMPGSALQQLGLWQLVLGCKVRENEAT